MDGNNQPQQPEPMAPQEPLQQPAGDPVNQPPMGSPYQMPPKKGLSKGALWGIIGGVIGLIVLIVGIVLAVVLLGGPTKEDYRRALDRTQDFSRDMRSYTGSMTGASNAKEAQKKIDELVKKMDDYTNELGKEKAITGDKEVKRRFDEMVAGYRQLQDHMKVVPKVMSLMQCKMIFIPAYGRSYGEVMAEFDKETAGCVKAMKDAENESDSDLKSYMSEYKKYLESYKAYLQRVTSGGLGGISPTSPSMAKLFNVPNKVMSEGRKASEKERELLKVLSEKAGVRAVVY